nr:DNA adenine methylase [uncultured Draconibacterium sp.]
MKYMGSKNRIAKHILPIILKNRTNELYVEPFVGGANLIDKVDGER